MLNASRRGFLRLTLGAAWSGGALIEQSVLRAAAARSQSEGAAAGLFTFEKMADGVWAALARPTTWINCNGAVFELSDGLLVMDSHSKPSAAAALVAQIRRDISAKPVRYLVNSHFHWDHAQGNSHYGESGAGVRIIASEATRRLLADGAAERMKLAVENAERALDRAKQAGQEKAVADTEAYLKELKAFRLELPDITVRGDLTLHDKLQELRIVFRGKGHTEGDVSVWSPARRALATGDLAHGSVPYMGDGFPKDWPNTLRSLGNLEFDKFAGGHAGVQTGRLRMDQMGGYIEELTSAVQEGMRRGWTVEQLQKEITLATLKSMGGGYLEALTGAGSAAGVASGVSGNVAQVFSALGRS